MLRIKQLINGATDKNPGHQIWIFEFFSFYLLYSHISSNYVTLFNKIKTWGNGIQDTYEFFLLKTTAFDYKIIPIAEILEIEKAQKLPAVLASIRDTFPSLSI